jgi:hypothetical protein
MGRRPARRRQLRRAAALASAIALAGGVAACGSSSSNSFLDRFLEQLQGIVGRRLGHHHRHDRLHRADR